MAGPSVVILDPISLLNLNGGNLEGGPIGAWTKSGVQHEMTNMLVLCECVCARVELLACAPHIVALIRAEAASGWPQQTGTQTSCF